MFVLFLIVHIACDCSFMGEDNICVCHNKTKYVFLESGFAKIYFEDKNCSKQSNSIPDYNEMFYIVQYQVDFVRDQKLKMLIFKKEFVAYRFCPTSHDHYISPIFQNNYHYVGRSYDRLCDDNVCNYKDLVRNTFWSPISYLRFVIEGYSHLFGLIFDFEMLNRDPVLYSNRIWLHKMCYTLIEEIHV